MDDVDDDDIDADDDDDDDIEEDDDDDDDYDEDDYIERVCCVVKFDRSCW